MKRLIAVVACSAAVAGCADFNMSMPSMDAFKPAPVTANVRVESDPAGAEAKAANGQSCRTPCTLAIPADGSTTVAVSLQGYLPQNIPVTVTAARGEDEMSDSGVAEDPIRVNPNPVIAQLEIAPPPPPPPRKKKAAPRKKPAPRAAAPAQPAPAARRAPAQQPAAAPPPASPGGGFGPPPPSSAPPPWPQQ
jgi:hypothetical protein